MEDVFYLCRDGDHYDALRDCLKALSLNPSHLKAHFRLARCLFELKYVAEALECLDDFKGKFPEQAHSSACDALDKDIKAALFAKSDSCELRTVLTSMLTYITFSELYTNTVDKTPCQKTLK